MSVFCWTDSTVVLAWLRQHASTWKTFVSNRVAEIHALVPEAVWQHVPTADNPADCASRGVYGHELPSLSLWWRGPDWMALSEGAWPRASPADPPASLLEAKERTSHVGSLMEPWDLANKYSSWPKLLRITAYVRRFAQRCHSDVGSQPIPTNPLILSAAEMDQSRTWWIKQIQSELFPAEIKARLDSKSMNSSSPLAALAPFVDTAGVLRVGGRLKNAPMSFAQKHPVILSSHPLVNLIIRHVHERMLHAGAQLTLLTLRNDMWILRARSLVKSAIHKCVRCARERAATPTQLMGDLPDFRVSPSARSFLHCGLDYAGPIQIRASAGRGIISRKAYIALFICMATKAIHLELVGCYSTTAFLDAFSRFCARRGLPESIYSDNGTTFVGADRELRQAFRAALRDPSVQNQTAGNGISWHFIPPSAPHFDGLWEAGVRSVKHHVRRTLGSHTLTFEEFSTLLCRIETCLNSRPLAPLNDTLDDYEVLTPGHFLIGSSLTVNPEPSLLHLKKHRLSRWQLVRQLTERFWRLWQSDYVNSLQQRGKWRTQRPSIKLGQIVLLRNATLPPCKWELGRVTECHPGPDGLTRVVMVKTSASEYKRPVVKLCLLPIDNDENGK